MIDPAPLYGLRLRTPRLELRLGSRDELRELGLLAEEGVHPPEQMPFAVAWTDAIGASGFVDDFVAHHEAALAEWSVERWSLELLAWANGVLVGSQFLAAEAFRTMRRVHTGSWLARAHQRHGLGTEMRAAVLELAFRGLGAAAAESSWLEGNDASRRVSEKLGYRVVGVTQKSPRGSPVPTTLVAIEAAEWRSPVPVELRGVEPCLPLFGGARGR